MHNLLNLAGTIAGALGVLLCLTAGISRLSGTHYLVGLETTTIFVAGTGLMVFACLLKLEVLVARLTRS